MPSIPYGKNLANFQFWDEAKNAFHINPTISPIGLCKYTFLF
ncbi:hypothetical protein HMPREF9446_00831 [Bacteroides fluxus YIT 12057]|uniref:Uncharacterized protein n=1 Tax=Bacteroides fluxus YIT 12057 TaxID=763034 RepID=F3PQ39_9BACE|nr:hypothetical protein HMPREF9446_00831 [Bacteroides fluxus YIT 12057]